MAGGVAVDVSDLAEALPPTHTGGEGSGLFERLWFHRSWWSAVGLMTIVWSWSLLAWVSTYPVLVPLVVILTVWGVLTLGIAWIRPVGLMPSRLFTAVMWTAVVLNLVAFVTWALLQIIQTPGYGTDELAFDQYAAQLASHGLNPYTHSMAPAFSLFHVQPDGYTYRLDGSAVTSLSYPSLAFLVYVPFLLLGWSAQLAVAINVLAWAAAILVVFALVPRPLRAMAIVIGSLSVYIGFAVGGITVALYVPLLAGAVWSWHRWHARRGWKVLVSPVLMGLAACINQVPWFVLPFVVVGIALEASSDAGLRGGLRAAGKYLVFVAVAFLVPNVPFLVADPHTWFRGTLGPLTTPTVPSGQGVVALPLYLHVGGGSLTLFSVLSGLSMLAALATFAAFYPRTRPLAVLLAAVPLLLATRSYGSYLFGLVPPALVGAVSTMQGPVSWIPTPRHAVKRRLWRRWPSPSRLTAGGLGVATFAVAIVAFVLPAPLGMSIQSVSTTGQLATVAQVTVSVHNRTDSTVRPHFTLNSGDTITTFWLERSGPAKLRPHQSATYTLLAPNFPAQPPISGGFQVVAFTTSPSAVSHSGSYLPTADHLALTPDAVNSIIPIGQQVTLHAQLLDHLNRAVHRAGVPVYLGQIVYAQAGLQYGEAIINGGQAGQTPVQALTNRSGVATFAIRGTQTSSDPVYFEANLVRQGRFYPYGYSQIVPIRFGT